MQNDYETVSYNDTDLPLAHAINRTITFAEHPALRIPRWHEQLEFKLLLEGSAEFTCGSHVFLAGPGDIVAVNSCEPHSMCPAQDASIRYHILMVSPNLLYSGKLEREVLSVFDGHLRFRNHIHDNALCQSLFHALFDALSAHDTAYALRAIGYLSLFLAELLRTQCVDNQPQAQYDSMIRDTKKLEPAFMMISEQYQTGLTLEDLASACGKSVYFFCRLFKQVTGQTVISYLNEYRINKAEMLLCSTDIPVNDIAASVGFPDNSYFARCFKQKKGITPSQCRLNHRTAVAE